MKIRAILFSTIFLIAIIIFPCSYYILNQIAYANGTNIDIDIGEKREKTEFNVDDSIDNLGKNIESYYNDRIPYRNFLIMADRIVNGFINSSIKPSTEIVNLNNEEKLEIDPYTDNYPLVCDENNIVIFGQSNWLFYNEPHIMQIFTKEKIADDSYFEAVSKEIAEIEELAKQKGVQICYLIAPDKQEVYEEYMPTIEKKNNVLNFPESIVEYVKKHNGIDIIYPRELLKSYKNKYRMYRKYDSHWNEISAYLATNEIYKKIGLSLPDIESLKIEKVEEIGFSGESVSPEARDLVLLSNMNYQDYPPSFEYSISYDGSPCDKTLCLIGDSFSVDMQKEILFKDFSNFKFVHGVDQLPKGEGLENIVTSDIIIFEMVERNLVKDFYTDLKYIKYSLQAKDDKR